MEEKLKDINNLRKEIIKIKNNNNLSQSDKNREIHNLMNIKKEDKNVSVNVNNDYCIHYPNKKCNYFYFSCCNRFFNCVRCHNESLNINEHSHNLTHITCSYCKLLQKPSNKCSYCNLKFSNNYCSICFIWTDKDIYHCNKCKICRVGSKDSLFHCDKCDTCFSIIAKDLHKCIEISYKSQTCAFCLESTYNSQNSSISLNCGHLVHNKCLMDASSNEQYKCPTCRKSMFKMDWSLLRDLIKSQPMPEEEILVGDIVICQPFGNSLFKVESINEFMYKGTFINLFNVKGTFYKYDLKKEVKKVIIYCNDCCKKSKVNFHYLGNECLHCNSFNTMI